MRDNEESHTNYFNFQKVSNKGKIRMLYRKLQKNSATYYINSHQTSIKKDPISKVYSEIQF